MSDIQTIPMSEADLIVRKIKNGTVIDHIEAGKGSRNFFHYRQVWPGLSGSAAEGRRPATANGQSRNGLRTHRRAGQRALG